MTTEQIEKVLSVSKGQLSTTVKVSFKTRAAIEGIFIKAPDYMELKKKNFWRMVSAKNMEDYRKSKDLNLSRIFNGAEFIKLDPKA